MVELITFRATGSSAQTLLSPYHPKRIGDAVHEVTLPLASEECRDLFLRDSLRNWDDFFISWWEIRREYTPQERAKTDFFHLSPRRVFAEPVLEDWSIYTFQSTCKDCLLIEGQLSPIILEKPLKSKDVLVQLADGAWLAKPQLFDRLINAGVSLPAATPVFTSSSKAKQWEARRGLDQGVRPGNTLGSSLDPWRLTLEELKEHDWVQLHILVGDLSIVPPTNAHYKPYADTDDADVLCNCSDVFGPSLLSEVHLQSRSVCHEDWSLTCNFIGWGHEGVYLPSRHLIVSKGVHDVLAREHLRSTDLDRAHVR